MQKAGVKVEIHEVKEAMHGYDIAADSDFVNRLLTQRIHFLRKAME